MATNSFYDTLVNYTVFPTENDHYGAGGVGAGRVLQELTLAPMFKYFGQGGFLISGFDLPSGGSGTTHTIAAGTAAIDGYYITGASNISCDFELSKTNYVYLKLEYDGSSKLYRPLIEVNDTGTQPSNSIYLGTTTLDGAGAATSVAAAPGRVPVIRGSYTGDADTSDRLIDVGCGDQIPTFVAVMTTQSGTNMLALGIRIQPTVTAGLHVESGTPNLVYVTFSSVGAQTRTYIPECAASGFYVEHDGSNPAVSMNENTIVYYYIVLL